MKILRQKGTREPEINVTEVHKYLSREGIAQANQTPKNMSDLIEQTKEARETLKEAVEGIGYNLETLKPLKREMIEELRSLRMTSTTEAAEMLKPLEDIRKFFLCDQHAKEVARLKEFVEICERLKKLKDSGFLDTVADTMLKLA